jgi:ubiquinone/menaquinone biosynthesis C-methylase UbiE
MKRILGLFKYIYSIVNSIEIGRFVFKLKRKVKHYLTRIWFLLRMIWFIRIFVRSRWNAEKLVIGDNNRDFACYGWETVDIIGADYLIDFRNQKMPFPDASVALVYCSHMIEHLSDDCAADMFAEIYRILKPKGIFRIVCPDLDKALTAYKENNKDFFIKPYGLNFKSKIGIGETPEDLLIHNNLVRILASYAIDGRGPIVEKEIVEQKLQECNRYEFAKWCVSLLDSTKKEEKCIWGHVNAYDFPKLKHMLEIAGFSDIVHSSFRQSQVNEFRKRCFDHKSKEWISLYVEATK